MKKMGISIAFLILLSAFYALLLFSPLWFADGSTKIPANTMLTGHRGAASFAPENTLASIRKALEFKAPRIEIDVQQTADSVVVALHDNTLDRTTNLSGAIDAISYPELEKADAGSWFSDEFKGERVPTLRQILDLINGRSTLVIEIKEGGERYPQIEENVLNLIREFKAEKWVIIHSFNDLPLFKLQKLAPDLEYHKLFVGKLPLLPVYNDIGFHRNALERYPFVTEFSFYYKFINSRIVAEAHKLGKRVNVWTVDDSTEMRKMVDIGVDGIITNNPQVFLNNREQ